MWLNRFIDIFRLLYQGDRSGQGEVYHSLVAYFQKDREGAINFRGFSAGESIPPPVVARYRKTCRTLIPPARFKGWKGKR